MILEQSSYASILRDELARRLQANPRYSQRAFARDLGLSPGEVSEVMRGVRKLSLRSVLRVAKALSLNEAETRHLGYLVQYERASGEDKEILPGPARRQELSTTMFNVVSDWYCFAILNLADTEGFRWNPKWIAKRLGISATEVSAALDRLEQVGLVDRKKGKYEICKDYVLSPDGIPSEAIRNFHRQILQKASRALDLQKITERDISGVGFAVDPKSLPAMKREISAFLDGIVAKYGRGRNLREVYQCEVALFRLTEPEQKS